MCHITSIRQYHWSCTVADKVHQSRKAACESTKGHSAVRTRDGMLADRSDNKGLLVAFPCAALVWTRVTCGAPQPRSPGRRHDNR